MIKNSNTKLIDGNRNYLSIGIHAWWSLTPMHACNYLSAKTLELECNYIKDQTLRWNIHIGIYEAHANTLFG